MKRWVLRGWCAFALLTLSARADKHLDYLRLALNINKLKERCDERKEEKKAKRLRGHMYKACTFAAMHIEWHPLGNVSSARRAESAAARKRLTSELRRCGVSLK